MNMFSPGKIVKTFKSKKGREVILRFPGWEDLDALLNYANKLIREDTFIQLSGKELTREEEGEFFKKMISDMENNKATYILAFNGKNLIGMCNVSKGKKRKSHVGLIGISVDAEFRSEGIGKEMLITLFEEAKKLDLVLLELTAQAPNVAALNLYKKLGFEEIGRGPGMIKYKNELIDQIWMYRKLSI